MFQIKRVGGIFYGVLTWIIYISFVIKNMACLKIGHICGGFNFFLMALIALGGLALAYIASMFVSHIVGNDK